MEKPMNNSVIEACKNKVTASLNMNPSSQLHNDGTKLNLKIDSTTSTYCSETILCSLLTNNNSPFMKCVTKNGDGHKTEKNGSAMVVENDNNNTVSLRTEMNSNIDSSFKSNKSATMSSLVPNILPDAKKIVENETKNGFSEFSCKSFYDSSAFDNMKNSYRDDNPAKKEENCIPVENDFRDILECSQFMRTGRKQYTNDAVNLDELNLSVSKILNSTKTNVEERKIENESSPTDAPCSKTFMVNKDHSYHLPLPLENGTVVKIEKLESVFNIDAQNNPGEKFCSTDLNSLSINKNDDESNSAIDASKNLQNSKSQKSTESIDNIQARKQSEHATSTDNVLTIESSNNPSISLPPPLIVSEETRNNEKNQTTTAKESKTGIVATKIDDTQKEEKIVKNSGLSTEMLPIEKKEQKQTLSEVDSSVMSEEFENQTVKNGENKTQVDQCSNLKPVDVLESVENKPQNTSNEKTANKDLEIQAANSEKLPFVVETSYDCNECGAKLKTQNSLFTHKKMHISGAIVTASAKKRKLKMTEENESPKETKRKRGRPKLVKTEISTETVTPLKENVAKKVLRNRAQSDELTQPKSKQSAKAVKENKISNIDKTPKSKRNLRVREPNLTKVISNKSKMASKSENCNNTNKTAAKIESVKQKGKTKNCYSSTATSDLLRKFVCPECGAKFKRNDHMKRHQLLHSEKSFQCCDCGMKFYRGDKLKLHTLRYHPAKPSKKTKAKLVVKAKLPKKSVECHKCGIQFLRIVAPKTDKGGQSRRKTSCCISCGAKMKDENN